MIVNVSTYRDAIAHLLHLVNDDYNACIGLAELRSWKGVTERALAELACVECGRASEADRKQCRRCVKVVRAQLVIAQARIEALEPAQRSVKAPHVRQGRPVTRQAWEGAGGHFVDGQAATPRPG